MEQTLEKILSELEMIRKIKMIELVERGYSQSKLGAALGISQATVSRMMASRKPANSKIQQNPAGDE